MRSTNYCEHCKVEVSSDLKYCPLCGKFVLNKEDGQVEENGNSYPIYDFSYIYRAKWLKVVKYAIICISLICILTNLLFSPKVYWFPYVVIGLYCIWKCIFFPYKEGQNHIRRIPVSGIIIAVSLILLDVYDHIVFKTLLGWAVVFAGPSVLTATTVLSLILSLATPKYDIQLIRGIVYLEIISAIWFIVGLFFTKHYTIWPIFMFFVATSVSLFILFLTKKKRMLKEINRNFHI